MKRWLITAFAVLSLMVAVKPSWAQLQETVFDLTAQTKFLPCFAQVGYTPSAQVIVQRGTDNDVLILRAQHIKPGLAFDLFTIQNTNLLANGQINPYFTNFGLAWYQTDLEADSNGNVEATIKTILLDQIFGFDPDQSNPNPINTFHVGFWFNNPNDANVDGCVFDVTKPTPFNGEHNAGPVAFISVPDAHNNLGPLCTNPNTSTTPASCNP